MKKILLILVCILSSFTIYAQDGVKWEEGTFEQALKKAKSGKGGKKLVFLDCYTTWCGPCKHMANVVFPTKEAGDYFNKNFVNIKIDMEKGEGIELAKKYAIAAYPTFLILDADGNEVGRVVGGGDINSFIQKVEGAKDVKNSPSYLKSAYENSKTMDNAVAYLNKLEQSYMTKDIADFFAANLNSFKVNEILSYPLWKYFKGTLSSNISNLDYVISNKAVANSTLGSDITNSTITNTYAQMLMSYLSGRKELTKEEVANYASTIKLLAIPSDKVSPYIANVAMLYSEGKSEEIAALYNFNNFISYTSFEIQPIERIFAGMKETTKEQIEKYYAEKEAFYKKQMEGCAGWRDMFIKAKTK